MRKLIIWMLIASCNLFLVACDKAGEEKKKVKEREVKDIKFHSDGTVDTTSSSNTASFSAERKNFSLSEVEGFTFAGCIEKIQQGYNELHSKNYHLMISSDFRENLLTRDTDTLSFNGETFLIANVGENETDSELVEDDKALLTLADLGPLLDSLIIPQLFGEAGKLPTDGREISFPVVVNADIKLEVILSFNDGYGHEHGWVLDIMPYGRVLGYNSLLIYKEVKRDADE